MTESPTAADVVVVGAGPCGIAAAGLAQARQLQVLVLEAGGSIAWRWRQHYDRLHLHSIRQHSALPGKPIPSSAGRWVSRDAYAEHISTYAESNRLRIEYETVVEHLDRDPGGWVLQTNRGEVRAGQVVIATGFNRTPVVPAWPGVESFHGRLIHSSEYKNAHGLQGKRVLVVGSGNSGAEIAADLAEQGIRDIAIAVRTPPNIVPRDFPVGLTLSHLALVLAYASNAAIDQFSLVTQRLLIGDLTKHGLPFPKQGMRTRGLSGRTAMIDVGFVKQLKAGRITVVAGLDRFEGEEVVCGARRLRPDLVIAATGFKRDLEPLVGHLGVLDGRGIPLKHAPAEHPPAPGLFFIGYKLHFTGLLWEMRRAAPVLAKRLQENARTQPWSATQAPRPWPDPVQSSSS